MSKRESGWYRVKLITDGEWDIAKYSSVDGCWFVSNYVGAWFDVEFHEIDPEMVMTPSGELVCHKAEHNPLYNTQQEG